MTGKDIAYGAATLLAGFLAYRVYRVAASGVDAGQKVITAVAEGVKTVVTEDLNPASSNNIVTRAVTATVSAATGREESLGTWLYGITHADKVGEMLKAPVSSGSAHAANDDFRRSEIIAENADIVTANQTESIMSDKRSSFRLSEIRSPYQSEIVRMRKMFAGE